MKNMGIKQNIDIIAQNDILIKSNGHKKNFLEKFTSKIAEIMYFLVIWKIKTYPSFP
jgi:4-hydroxyphenylpyruvate dioxygenase-like putative hemolysin